MPHTFAFSSSPIKRKGTYTAPSLTVGFTPTEIFLSLTYALLLPTVSFSLFFVSESVTITVLLLLSQCTFRFGIRETVRIGTNVTLSITMGFCPLAMLPLIFKTCEALHFSWNFPVQDTSERCCTPLNGLHYQFIFHLTSLLSLSPIISFNVCTDAAQFMRVPSHSKHLNSTKNG